MRVHSLIIGAPRKFCRFADFAGLPFDMVFIDADKPAYIQYFNLVFPQLRKNGFILADNIFFHGHSLESEPKEKSAQGIKEFNDFIKNNGSIEKVVLTIRDGLYLMKKK